MQLIRELRCIAQIDNWSIEHEETTRLVDQDDLFTRVLVPTGFSEQWESRLDVDLLRSVIGRPHDTFSDLQFAACCVDLIHSELRKFATSGDRLVTADEQMKLLLICGRITCERVGVPFPLLPFRDFDSFYEFWKREGMTGGGAYSRRRAYLDSLFSPVKDALFELTLHNWDTELLRPVSPHGATGWHVVDSEINELRSRFKWAVSAQDCNAVGNSCIRLLEIIGDAAYDPSRHRGNDGCAIPRGQTKSRFDAIIEAELSGPENAVLRKYARSLTELAQEVKHRLTSNRRDAGIASDAVVTLAHLLRRITTRQ